MRARSGGFGVMKNWIGALFICGLSFSAIEAAYGASSSSNPIAFGFEVQGTLTMTVELRKNHTGGAVVTAMDFGKLINIGTGSLRSSTTSTTGTGAICALVRATSPSAPYVITQSGSALSNGITTLPAGACTVVPTYNAADNGGALLPAGASVGTKGTWVENGKVLYTSGPDYSTRNVTCYYSITDDPAAGASTGVPINQPGGVYTGTITFTVSG